MWLFLKEHRWSLFCQRRMKALANWLAIAVPFGIVALVGAGTGAALFMKRRHETTEEESE